MNDELRINPMFEEDLEGKVKEFRLTGEDRPPLKGEWLVYIGGGSVSKAMFSFPEHESRPIVEVIYE